MDLEYRMVRDGFEVRKPEILKFNNSYQIVSWGPDLDGIEEEFFLGKNVMNDVGSQDARETIASHVAVMKIMLGDDVYVGYGVKERPDSMDSKLELYKPSLAYGIYYENYSSMHMHFSKNQIEGLKKTEQYKTLYDIAMSQIPTVEKRK